MMEFWVIIAFLTTSNGSLGVTDYWINYKDAYPTKVYCETFLRSRENILSTRLISRLKERGMAGVTVDELICVNSKELDALDENQYLDLYKSAGMVI